MTDLSLQPLVDSAPVREQSRGSIVADRHLPRDYYLRRVLAVTDQLALLGALAVALVVADGGISWRTALVAVIIAPIWLVLFALYGLYDRDIRRISHTTVDDLPGIFHALLVGTILLWGLSRVVPGPNLLFASLILFALLASGFVLTVRAISRRVVQRLLGPERVLVVGSSAAAGALVAKMRRRSEYNLLPVGVLAERSNLRWPVSLPSLGVLGVTNIDELVDEHDIDRVVVATETIDDDRVIDLLRRCKSLSVKVSLLPAMFSVMGHSTQVDDIEGLTLLGINAPVLSRSSRMTKRFMDVIGAGLSLVLAAPAMLIIAVAIKLDSRGPVFFRQERVGRGGRRFPVVKFRSMAADAEDRRAALMAQSTDPNWLHLERDPRITRVGGLLRRMSLDELPQLWNVVRGDMSLVGPRPLIPSEDEQVDGWRRNRLDLTPGITGLWQVLGRTSIPFEEMVKLDYAYVANWSLWGDVRLVLRTIPVVLARRGVN